jgi:hypothetical protein
MMFAGKEAVRVITILSKNRTVAVRYWDSKEWSADVYEGDPEEDKDCPSVGVGMKHREMLFDHFLDVIEKTPITLEDIGRYEF